MRIIELNSDTRSVTLFANKTKTSFEQLVPMDLLVSAIAKDILDEIQRKADFHKIQLDNFSVQVVLKKNNDQEKSKIIETHILLPDSLPSDLKNKFQKIADKAHLKRMLGNEILFEPSRLKE
jgi:hypothetical protein